jgi:hypothetical protein
MWLAGREQVQAPSDRTLAPIGRAGGGEQDGSSMIGGSIERASPDRTVLTSFSSSARSNLSSSRSGLNLASVAQTRNAINDKKQNAPYTSKTSAIILHLASLAARPINKMTGFKWTYYPPKIWNVIQQRWGGVCITLHNSVIVPHEKGQPESRPLPVPLRTGVRRRGFAAVFAVQSRAEELAARRLYQHDAEY